MKTMRKWLAVGLTSAVLLGGSLMNAAAPHFTSTLASDTASQPQTQLVCTGASCGNCCD